MIIKDESCNVNIDKGYMIPRWNTKQCIGSSENIQKSTYDKQKDWKFA